MAKGGNRDAMKRAIQGGGPAPSLLSPSVPVPIDSEVVLTFPNNTVVRLSGDIDIVRQLLERINGMNISYTQTIEGHIVDAQTN